MMGTQDKSLTRLVLCPGPKEGDRFRYTQERERGESKFKQNMFWIGRRKEGKGMRACRNTSNLWLDLWAYLKSTKSQFI